MISLNPAAERVRKLLYRPYGDLETCAVEDWIVEPESQSYVQPAVFLPGQLDRIRGTMFASADDIVMGFKGGFAVAEGATYGFRVRHVDLVDGVLYGRRSVRHLSHRSKYQLAYQAPSECVNGVLYESWLGNRWFASWLAEDCLTYRLAEAHGQPVTSRPPGGGHMPDYEARLGIKPLRMARAHFNELVFFRESNNSGRSLRAADLRRRLLGERVPTPHAGVFLLRGTTGNRRLLRNEAALAEELAHTRGFRILDPSNSSVEQIIEDCAGAEVVVGVEGSHLVHGIMLMPPRAALLVLQPPERVVGQLKMFTDRQNLRYALVIGSGGAAEFEIDLNEINQTLDLL
jgi:hypothetical protein